MNMSECTHDCSSCGADCASRGQDETSLLAELNPRSSVKKVIAVMSGKGGVGKSLVTSLLACESARRGYKTAILDGDITGPSIPASFGLHQKADSDGEVLFPVRSKSGIDVMSINLLLEKETDPVLWRGPVIGGVIRQFWTDVLWDDVDFMFVDMPPGTGDAQITLLQSLPIAGIVIVTSPQELVGMIVSKAVNMAKTMDVPLLGIVENMSYLECPDCGRKIPVFGESHLEETALEYDTKILAQLPIDPAVAAAVDRGEVESVSGERVKTAMDVIARLLK
jgi:Mrp family chromosome partitioning ATPase